MINEKIKPEVKTFNTSDANLKSDKIFPQAVKLIKKFNNQKQILCVLREFRVG